MGRIEVQANDVSSYLSQTQRFSVSWAVLEYLPPSWPGARGLPEQFKAAISMSRIFNSSKKAFRFPPSGKSSAVLTWG
jgi:uncharacterized membrane protein YhdT